MALRPVVFQPQQAEYEHPGLKAMSLRAMAEQAREHQLRTAEIQRQREAATQVRNVIGMYGGEITPQVAREVAVIDPKAAMDITKYMGEQAEQQFKANKEQRLAEAAALDLNLKKLAHVGGVLNTITDEPSMHRAVGNLLSRDMMPRDLAMHYLQQPWTPELQAEIKQAVESTKTTEQQLKDQYAAAEEGRKAEEEKRKAALHPDQVAKAQAETLLAQQKVAGTEAISPYQQTVIAGQEAGRKETGRHNLAMEAAAMLRARKGEGGGDNAALVQAIIENPNIYDNLTPTKKTAIATDLAKAGFGGFGKQLSGTEITKLANSKTAIQSLGELQGLLKQNEQYVGPIAGLQRFLPYSDARKIQANINLVKQRVGKELEGGVLRKEDEEKYKQILATLADEPSTAAYKVDNLIRTVQRDLDTYQNELRSAGRRVAPQETAEPSSQLVKSTGPGGETIIDWTRSGTGKAVPKK